MQQTLGKRSPNFDQKLLLIKRKINTIGEKMNIPHETKKDAKSICRSGLLTGKYQGQSLVSMIAAAFCQAAEENSYSLDIEMLVAVTHVPRQSIEKSCKLLE